MPRSRSGLHASHEDLLFGLLHFPSGATGMLDVNWLTPAKRRQLSVVGEAGMFELDYLTQRLTFTSADIGSPTMIDGYATTFEGNVVGHRRRQPGAARRRARRLPRGRAVRRPPGGGRRGRPVGGRDRVGLLQAAAEGRPSSWPGSRTRCSTRRRSDDDPGQPADRLGERARGHGRPARVAVHATTRRGS